MIVITGAAGFIGSCVLGKLNQSGIIEICIVDDFQRTEKRRNIKNKSFAEKIHRNDFPEWFRKHAGKTQAVLHIGARTDTTEKDENIFQTLNYRYSKMIWDTCTEHGIPLIYASSAATYGGGELGYSDDHVLIKNLKPLNAYAISKNEFDKYVLQQTKTPPFWAGLKFFNVYGPNEYHKNRMASVIFHAHRQMLVDGKIKLFRSHKKDFADGMQARDFIYVKDIAEIISWMLKKKPANGIYNVGNGTARTFYELAENTAYYMKKPLVIDWIDIPADIRDTYQYFTQAPIQKLRNAGYLREFYSLDEGIKDYVKNFLKTNLSTDIQYSYL